MKGLLLLSFSLISFCAFTQNLSWFRGDWTGETYFPNGPITKRIIVKLHVVKLNGNHFEATLANLYPNDTTIRLERAISGQIINKKLIVEKSAQTYILDPRTQNFWRDCTGCEIESSFSINSDKILIQIKTTNCGDECDGETNFSRDTSSLNPAQQDDFAKWLQPPATNSLTKKGKTKAKDSLNSLSKTNTAVPKKDTTTNKKAAAKDTITSTQKLQPAKLDTANNKLQKAILSSKQKTVKDSLSAKVIKPEPIKKDSLNKPDIPKPDTTPVALTTRATNLVTTYQVSSPHIVIQLFDNAEIDGDVVTVYHNGQLIVNHQSLTHKAITITVDASKTNAHHEFVMVADNLGLISPNTALMRIVAGKQKFEVEVSSDFDNNSKIAIDYTGE